MEKSKDEKYALLLETIAYYNEDPKRRCVGDDGACYYSPTNAYNSISDGCAIGRLLEPDLKISLDVEEGTIDNDSVWDKLPLHIQAYGRAFLGELQELHDSAYSTFWDSKGLTESGKEQAELLKEKILNGKV